MTDSPSNSFKSAEQWLDELESELINVSPSMGSDITSDLSSSNNENNQHVKSRKIRNRMMQLYLTIASEDLKTSNKKSISDSQPYYTIVDSNNNNLNNINRAFLKKLDEKEIAQLKKLMLTRELSHETKSNSRSQSSKTEVQSRNQLQKNTNASKRDRMLVLCSPVNSKTNKLIDSLIDQLEKQYIQSNSKSTSQLFSNNTTQRFSVHSPTKSNSTSIDESSLSLSSSMSENFEFDEMNAKTEKLKTRMMNLKKKYEILKQKRAFEKRRKKKLFSAHVVNSAQAKTNKKSKQTAKKTKSKAKRQSMTGNAIDFQTKLKRYGTHYNVNANRFDDKHVEIVERRSASMSINPKSLKKTVKNARKTKRKGVKSQRKRRRNPAARIPWRG